MELLISTMEQKIQRITLWLEKSGLKVNSMKTELCLFHKNDTPPVTLKIGLDELSSKPTMNVLGIIFDTKMQWCPQVSQ